MKEENDDKLISFDEWYNNQKIPWNIKAQVKFKMFFRHINWRIRRIYRKFVIEKVFYNYSSIQELIQNTDVNKVLEELKKITLFEGEEFTDELKESYINVFNYLKNCDIIHQDVYIDDPKYKIYYVLVKEGNVTGIGHPYVNKNKDIDVENMPDNYFPDQPYDHECFGIELSDWKYIAGLPYRTTKKLNSNNPRVVAEILWEITYFGYTTESISYMTEILGDRLEKAKQLYKEDPS